VSTGKENAGSVSRYEVLDSLRGVCAIIVVLYHSKTPGFISHLPPVYHGSRFVDFFFVLSGFVIAASYGDRLSSGFSIGRFMALRLGRIYPLHLFMLGVFVLFELIFASGLVGKADRLPFTRGYTAAALVQNVFLVQTFFGPDGSTWNSPSWSIAVEMWTYLIFAFIYRFFRRALISVAVATMLFGGYYLFLTGRYLSVVHNGALVRCMIGFAAGTVAYHVRERLPVAWAINRLPATVLEVVTIAVVAVLVPLTSGTPSSLLMPLVFLGAILVFSMEGGAVSDLLRTRPFLVLGTLSYSIYMVHYFLIFRLINVLVLVEHASHGRLHLVAKVGNHTVVAGTPLFGDCMSILLLATTIGAAALTYRFIEMPGRQLSRKLALGRPSAVDAQRQPKRAPAFQGTRRGMA